MKLKLRVKYRVTEEGRFLGHLDLTRTIMKVLRRANLPVMLSEGFNPHPKLSFAMPLSVGHTSEGEFFEVVLKEDISEEKFKKVFNESSPKAIHVLEVKEVKGNPKSMSSMINSAKYILRFEKTDCILLKEKANSILEEEEIKIIKKSKKKTKEADIRPFIYEIVVYSLENDECIAEVSIAHGSTENLKVQELTNLFLSDEISIENISTERKGLYVKKGDTYSDLMEILTNVG